MSFGNLKFGNRYVCRKLEIRKYVFRKLEIRKYVFGKLEIRKLEIRKKNVDPKFSCGYYSYELKPEL
jgi:hypothetical protein